MYEWIDTEAALLDAVHHLSHQTEIAVDTEFIRESTFFPRIALIQIASAEKIFLIDPIKISEEQMRPLATVLKAPTVLKVLHSAYADQECFYWNYHYLMEPILDTAVAAAMLGMGDQIALHALLTEEMSVKLGKGLARTKWDKRPLEKQLLNYAADDVRYLLPLLNKLRNKLMAQGRWDWAVQESQVDSSAFDSTPEELEVKMTRSGYYDGKTRGVLLELLRWREKRVREVDLPRNWVASNEVLIALARSKPRSAGDLTHYRGLSSKEASRSGEAIIAAILKGSAEGTMEDIRPVRLQESQEVAIAMLKTFITLMSAQHGIAGRFLISTDVLPRLLRNYQKGRESWVRENWISEFADQMIGQELEALLNGKRAFVMREGALALIEC